MTTILTKAQGPETPPRGDSAYNWIRSRENTGPPGMRDGTRSPVSTKPRFL